MNPGLIKKPVTYPIDLRLEMPVYLPEESNKFIVIFLLL